MRNTFFAIAALERVQICGSLRRAPASSRSFENWDGGALLGGQGWTLIEGGGCGAECQERFTQAAYSTARGSSGVIQFMSQPGGNLA